MAGAIPEGAGRASESESPVVDEAPAGAVAGAVWVAEGLEAQDTKPHEATMTNANTASAAVGADFMGPIVPQTRAARPEGGRPERSIVPPCALLIRACAGRVVLDLPVEIVECLLGLELGKGSVLVSLKGLARSFHEPALGIGDECVNRSGGRLRNLFRLAALQRCLGNLA